MSVMDAQFGFATAIAGRNKRIERALVMVFSGLVKMNNER